MQAHNGYHTAGSGSVARCDGCGWEYGSGHTAWCHIGHLELDREKKTTLRFAAPSQPAENPAPSFVPTEELLGSPMTIPTKDHPPQGGGFKRSKAEIEAEAGERGELVIIQWHGEQPLKATAYLAQVLDKPDGRRLIRDWRELGEVLPLYPTEQAADALGRKPGGIMVRLKP